MSVKKGKSKFGKQCLDSIKEMLIAKELEYEGRLCSSRKTLAALSDGQRKASTTNMSGCEGDLVDVASNAIEESLQIGMLEVYAETIKKIEETLSSILNGTYGVCTNCSRSIPAKRLKAIPWARMCVKCADALDQPWEA